MLEILRLSWNEIHCGKFELIAQFFRVSLVYKINLAELFIIETIQGDL